MHDAFGIRPGFNDADTGPDLPRKGPCRDPDPRGGGLVPGTTQVPPDYLGAAFDVQKDSVYAIIMVTYRDGLGQSLLQYSVVRVTLADGTVVQGTIQPRVGVSYQTQGTKRSDRVEIFVSYADGSVHKIYDQLVPFQNLNPV
jgi:hypothetical protein